MKKETQVCDHMIQPACMISFYSVVYEEEAAKPLLHFGNSPPKWTKSNSARGGGGGELGCSERTQDKEATVIRARDSLPEFIYLLLRSQKSIEKRDYVSKRPSSLQEEGKKVKST